MAHGVGKHSFAKQAAESNGSTSFMWDNMEYQNFLNKE